MSENFVRKTLNVENIEKKETYTLHDLDLVETKEGRVFIRIFKQNAKPDSTDQNAYLYELTNTVRMVNRMPLGVAEQLNNSGHLLLPLVMELQYLADSVNVTMAGNTSGIYKVNGVAGVYKNGITIYTIPLTGDSLPDVTIKTGNTVVDVYKLHQADLHQENPLHPEFVKGAKECCERLASVENRVGALETRVDNIIHPIVSVSEGAASAIVDLTTDQPDDPAFQPTRPSCLDDIKVFVKDDTVHEVTLDWDSRCTGIIDDPDHEGKMFHAFYNWSATVELTKDSYVMVQQNGVIVSNSFIKYQELS